jgi:hypothetical protein
MTVVVRNLDPAVDYEGVGLEVTLPPQVASVKAKLAVVKRSRVAAEVVDSSVTWPVQPLRAGTKRIYRLVAQVSKTALRGDDLVFQASAYHTDVFCSTAAANVTVGFVCLCGVVIG